jgi:hypothetical protein
VPASKRPVRTPATHGRIPYGDTVFATRNTDRRGHVVVWPRIFHTKDEYLLRVDGSIKDLNHLPWLRSVHSRLNGCKMGFITVQVSRPHHILRHADIRGWRTRPLRERRHREQRNYKQYSAQLFGRHYKSSFFGGLFR